MADFNEFREAIEQMHGGTATLSQSVPVRETFEGTMVWEGVVHIFDLAEHPTTTRVYAFVVETDDKRRIVAVLHQGPIDSPQAAIRAAIVAGQRQEARLPPERPDMSRFLHNLPDKGERE